MIGEELPARSWYRFADSSWEDPLDTSYAATHGGRWNPPASWPTLYVNADVATARANVRRFLAGSPVEPEDLDDERGYVLVEAALPALTAANAHSDVGLTELGLPGSYPLDGRGREVPLAVCQQVGRRVHDAGLGGVHCRSAAGKGRELAWYPGPGQRARRRRTRRFRDWYY